MSIAMARADISDTAPLWRDAVVGASIAAMAAAAGLGTYYEVGASTWLSIAVGSVTAAGLWGAHRQLGYGHVAPRQPAHQQRDGVRAAPVRRAPHAASDAVRPPEAFGLPSLAGAGMPPLVATGTPHRAVDLPAPAVAAVLAERVDLSSFAPRQSQPHLQPMASQAPVQAAHDVATTTSPATTIPAYPGHSSGLLVPPPAVSIDPEAQFLHLQGLVRQLAAGVGGPRAASPDPDRGSLPARELPPVQVGFGRAEVAAPPADMRSPDIGRVDTALPMARLAEAVAAERFDVLLEPIQKIAEARARHFEISVRFRDADGDVLAPDEVKRIARHTGLATSIDALKLPGVAKVVQRVHSRSGTPSDVLTTLSGASLADHAFLEGLAMAFPVGVPGTLVLSFPQADIRAFARIHWSALSALADMGLRFALDDVSDLDMDFELLRARQFVFAKIDARIFLDGMPCSGTSVPPSDIRRHLEGAGLDLIVSGIDSESQMTRIAPHAVPFGQGKLFGTARPVKADILR
jgi:cyclic-di-GMP phosphodiesterase, flagellum assembly factor TipF